MKKSVLVNILENHGYVKEGMIEELANDFPNLQLVCKMSVGPRFLCSASKIKKTLTEKEERGDFCREVFIPADTLSVLRVTLGLN